jgi:hypothetical protein
VLLLLLLLLLLLFVTPSVLLDSSVHKTNKERHHCKLRRLRVAVRSQRERFKKATPRSLIFTAAGNSLALPSSESSPLAFAVEPFDIFFILRHVCFRRHLGILLSIDKENKNYF